MKMKCISSVWIITFLTGYTFLRADGIDDYIRDEMKLRNIPGLAFAVVDNGKIVRTSAYGFANLEHDAPTRTDSVFELASTTKQFTAAAVILLVEDGKVSLADDITKYIPDAPTDWRGITIEHILTHTSGLPVFFPFQHDPKNPTELTTAQMLESIREAKMIGKPGRQAQYSDPGYFLLGMVIEKASGMRYAAFLQQYIFDPVKMKSSSVLDQWRIIKHRVAPYTLRGKNLLRGRRDWQQELPSHYGVFSSIEDMARWGVALQTEQILSATTLAKMWTPARLRNGKTATVWGLNYGFGWMLGDYRGYKVTEHGGFAGTHIMMIPEKQLTVIILTNLDVRSGSEPHILARGIAGLYDPNLAQPHTLTPQSKPQHDLTQRADRVLQAAASGSDCGDDTTTAYAAYLRKFPPFARKDLSRRLESKTEFKLIITEDVTGRGLTRFDENIARLAYFDLIGKSGKWCYTFWLTKDDKVAAMRSYRHP